MLYYQMYCDRTRGQHNNGVLLRPSRQNFGEGRAIWKFGYLFPVFIKKLPNATAPATANSNACCTSFLIEFTVKKKIEFQFHNVDTFLSEASAVTYTLKLQCGG